MVISTDAPKHRPLVKQSDAPVNVCVNNLANCLPALFEIDLKGVEMYARNKIIVRGHDTRRQY